MNYRELRNRLGNKFYIFSDSEINELKNEGMIFQRALNEATLVLPKKLDLLSRAIELEDIFKLGGWESFNEKYANKGEKQSYCRIIIEPENIIIKVLERFVENYDDNACINHMLSAYGEMNFYYVSPAVGNKPPYFLA